MISPTVAKWFVRHRGKATGIATAGLNAGAVVLTRLILFLIHQFGWRSAWFFLGFVPWIVVVPPSLLWLLAAYEVLSGMSLGALIIHRLTYATDLGFSDVQAGVSFGIYGVCAFAAKLAWGFLADRYSIWLLAIIALMLSAISIFAGVGSTSVWQLHGTFGVMYGLTGGALVVISPLLWAAHFGRQHQGTIRGVMSHFYLIASIGGPLFAAFVYDQVGGLDAAFRVFAAYLVAQRHTGLVGRSHEEPGCAGSCLTGSRADSYAKHSSVPSLGVLDLAAALYRATCSDAKGRPAWTRSRCQKFQLSSC